MNVIKEITNEELSELIEIATKNDIYYEGFEGSLRDNFIFFNAESINIEGKSSKYIIVKEVYLNEWSSDLMLIMTNSDEEVESFEMRFSA